jgi:hypothetical protein
VGRRWQSAEVTPACLKFLQLARSQAMYRPDYDTLMERLTNQSTVVSLGSDAFPREIWSMASSVRWLNLAKCRIATSEQTVGQLGNASRRTACLKFLQLARSQAMYRPDYDTLMERLTNVHGFLCKVVEFG